MISPAQIEALHRVSEETRAAFEAGNVSDTEIEEAARLYKVASWVTNRSGIYTPLGDRFPNNSCGHASPVLKRRIDASGILSEEAKLVHGGYWHDQTHEYDEWHAFVEVDTTYDFDTNRVTQTIADITADQFGGPSVYVGRLVLPWSSEPRIDLWEA